MRIPMILVAVTLGLMSTGVTYFALRKSRQPGTMSAQHQEVVARQALPAGSVLTADLLEARQVSGKSRPPELAQLGDLVGKTAVRDVSAGEVLKLSDVRSTDSSNPTPFGVQIGLRAFVVPVERSIGAATLAQTGDRVDILHATTSTDGTARARTVAQNIRVLVGYQAPSVAKEKGEVPPEPEKIPLMLEVTPAESEKLFAAQSVGRLAVALRNRSDMTLLPPEVAAPVRPAPPPVRKEQSPEPVVRQRHRQAIVVPPVPSVPGGGPVRPLVLAAPETPRRVTPGKSVVVVVGKERQVIEVED